MFTLRPGYFAIEPATYQKADSEGIIQTVEAKPVNATFGRVVAVGGPHRHDDKTGYTPQIGDLVFVQDGSRGRTSLPWDNRYGGVYICSPDEVIAVEPATLL